MGKHHPIDLNRIFGRIQYVSSFEDHTVRVVEMLPDLRVQEVPFLADAPGKWEIVDAFPDFRIKIVSENEDFTIEYVDMLPGL